MNKKIFNDLGLTSEQAESILSYFTKEIESVKEEYENYIKESSAKIKAFEEEQETHEVLKDEIIKLKGVVTKKDEELKSINFNYGLRDKLQKEYKVKDPNDIIHMLDIESIGEDFNGLSEQVNDIKTEKGYLFQDTSGGFIKFGSEIMHEKPKFSESDYMNNLIRNS